MTTENAPAPKGSVYFIVFNQDGTHKAAGLSLDGNPPEGAVICTREQQSRPNSYILKDGVIAPNPADPPPA